MRMICQECDDNTERTHEQKLKVLVDKGFCLTGDNLTSQQFAELVSLLYEYNDAFATDIGDLPGVKGVEYEIKLQPGTRPKRQRQYRYSPELRQVIRDQLKQWEKAGIAEEGGSYWSHPVFLVKKKSEVTDSPPKYRMCLDLRELNKCVLDALHGYLQLNVTQESSKFLGVEGDEKSYILKRLPFGLATSPYAYQKLMNFLLSPYQFVFAAAYLDDLLDVGVFARLGKSQEAFTLDFRAHARCWFAHETRKMCVCKTRITLLRHAPGRRRYTSRSGQVRSY